MSKSINRGEPYILRADGHLHTADIRGVSISQDGNTIVTASRDHTAQLSAVPLKGCDRITSQRIFAGHEAFVNTAWIHPSIGVLDGDSCLVTASNDNHVALWGIETGMLEAVLDGHAQGVCCAALIGDHPVDGSTALSWTGDIVCGDWGGACIVFDRQTGRAKQLYSKHAIAIRGVAHLPGTLTVVSGSGDKTLHAWDLATGETKQIFSGHADVVQCVCAISADLFASGSNDCTVRVWKVGQEAPVKILSGHDSLIYTVAFNGVTGELVTASEDRSVRVWGLPSSAPPPASINEDTVRQWGLVQVISHPCVVWSVAPNPVSGDLATGGSDAVLRLWTRDDDYVASPEALESLEQQLASQTVNAKIACQQPGGLDVKSMPAVDDLHKRRGQAEGERVFARGEGGAIEVFTWGSNRWNKLGTVVAGSDQQPYTGAPLQREKKYHNGCAFDYVFDVDVEGRPLKLTYNIGDSVFDAAQRFIDEHQGIVAQDNKEQIQNFLMEHLEPEDLQRVPGLGGNPPPPLPSGAMPARSSADGDGSVPCAPWDKAEAREGLNVEAAQRKISQLLHPNEKFASVLARVQGCVQRRDPSVAIIGPELQALYAALPIGQRFPAVDAWRYLLCAAPGNMDETFWKCLAAALPQILSAAAAADTSDAELLTTLRLLSNIAAAMCVTGLTCDQLLVGIEKVAASAASRRGASSATRSAIAVLLQNTSVMLRMSSTSNSSDQLVTIAVATVRVAAQVLLTEPCGSAVVPSILRTLLTLLLRAPGGSASPPEWSEAARACGRQTLLFSLRSVQSGVDRSCHEIAALLIGMLEEHA